MFTSQRFTHLINALPYHSSYPSPDPLLTAATVPMSFFYYFYFFKLSLLSSQIWEYQHSISKVRLQSVCADKQQCHKAGEEDEIKVP